MQKFRFRYRIFKIRFRSSPNPCKSLYIFALLICYVYFECTNRFLTKIYWISNYQNNQKIKWPKLKITEGTHQKRATIPRKIKNKNFKKKKSKIKRKRKCLEMWLNCWRRHCIGEGCESHEMFKAKQSQAEIGDSGRNEESARISTDIK